MSDKPILVTSYRSPDLDGFGGAWAYAELLNHQRTPAVARFFQTPRGEEQYVMNLYGAEYPPTIPNDSDFEQVILVDASTIEGLEGNVTPSKVVEVIDHRKVHTADTLFPNAKLQIEPVGSACTLVAERWYEYCHSWADSPAGEIDTENPGIHGSSIRNGRHGDLPVKDDNYKRPAPLSAALLYGGIISNTLNFKANVTTDCDRAMRDWLRSIEPFSDDFAAHLFEGKSDLSGDKLHNRFLGESALFEFNTSSVILGPNEIRHRESMPSGSSMSDSASGSDSRMTKTRVMITQIELIGAKALILDRKVDLLRELSAQADMKLADYAFLSLIDLEEGANYFLADHAPSQQLVSAVLSVDFHNEFARREGLIMRKEIVPMLKNHLEM